MPTSTVEDYLKAILQAEQARPDSLVPTGQIATALGVAPGTATAMVKTLADSGLLEHEPYSGVRLTSAGEQLAAHVLRRHRLIELFLVKVMGMDWSEVHPEAEQLEHVVSDRLLERIDEMLGRPRVDPHGDPIPSASGVVQHDEHPSLLSCSVGRLVAVVRVTDQEGEFLKLIESVGLKPGSRVTVTGRDNQADAVELDPENGDRFTLGYRAAAKVLVKPA